MIETLLLACLLLLAYTHVGYPGLLWLLSRVTGARPSRAGEPTQWPSVSIIISAHNEEQVIGDRLRNVLDLDYPPERLECLVGSDGSTDRTAAIVDAYAGGAIRLATFADRRGKASVLNDLIERATGDVVVLTDANTFFHPDAVRALVTALWRHPTACAVVGRLELRSPTAAGNLDGKYWRFETWLKTLESHFGTVLGANGAIYAFHRARYRPLPTEAIVDDFLVPMLMRLDGGGDVLFVPAARAYETSPAQLRHELHRRVRIGAGDLQALLWTWQLLLPWNGMVAFSYFSHKVLRWFGPWLMLTIFVGNFFLLGRPFFRWLFLVQLGFYGLGALTAIVRPVPLLEAQASAVWFFIVLNAGLGWGFVRFALARQRPFWSTAPRSGGPIHARPSAGHSERPSSPRTRSPQ